MYQNVITLTDFILKEEAKIKQATGKFTLLMTYIANASKVIASHVRKSGLVDIFGTVGTKNIYNEEVQKLDKFSNQVLIDFLINSGQVFMLASEENIEPIYSQKKDSKYLIFIDPLDGSSNIDVNVSIGTIFSIYKKNNSYLQKGLKQVAAGYILYGSSVTFVYSVGHGVHEFTLDPEIGSFLLSRKSIQIPKNGTIYSINEAYYSSYSQCLKKYLNYLKTVPKLKARYIGSLVSDVHRTLLKGGIFLYPEDKNNPNGKLRLMFEVNPMAFLIQQAGGLAISQNNNPLAKQPTSLHQRAPIVLGSKENVEKYAEFCS